MADAHDRHPEIELPQVVIAQAAAAAQSRSSHGPLRTSRNVEQASIPQAGDVASTSHMLQQTPIEHEPPPAYSETYGEVDINQGGFDTKARVANDGRVNIRINENSRALSSLLVPALRSQLDIQQADEVSAQSAAYIPPSIGGEAGRLPPPPLNVVIHVVGSRGDVQPFVALGKTIKALYNHRVRLATHPTFKTFVEENGLEFFSIGGDPAELMAFMVKNPGLMPGMDTLRSGDVGKRRRGMYEIVQGCWRSCIEIGDGSGTPASDDLDSRSSLDSGISMDGDISAKPFVADAIIANPPSFAHIHCAEKLGIPLHLMFTMPWSPTQAFPHPLANIQSSNADASMTNFVSYALVEMMTWQGLGDIINRFRENSLGLEPVSIMWAPGMASRLRIPYTYCWSPALIPKPKDWGAHISISGFYFLSLASSFTPEPDLAAFLEAGPPPVYIGFGSIVVDDPNAMTKLIFEAVTKTGQRALVSKGWGGFGADQLEIPEGIFMLGNVPHDWLFKHVSCVVHHGGAGTTAAGIALGKPTVVVPFFGDQPFWGAMVAKAGAGPMPIPSKQLTSDNLASAIQEALKPTALERAQELGARISSEKGTELGAQSFMSNLDIDSLRCTVAPSRAAVWRVKRTKIRLSAFVATALANEGLLDFNDLKLYRPKEYDSEDGPWDPFTGAAAALLGTIGSLMMGVADFPIEFLKAIKIAPGSQSSHGKEKQTSGGSNTVPTSTSSTQAKSSTTSLTGSTSHSSESTALPSTPNIVHSQIHGITAEPQSILEEGDPHQTAPLSPKSTSDHRSMLGRAIRRSSSRSRSPSGRNGTKSTGHPGTQSQTEHEGNQMTLDSALRTGKGVGRIVGVGLKSPMDFTMSLARGFHNAPKLYGDESVRTTDKVTGIQSGLKAAGKEFGYGLYDGISGLVTQPLEGAKKEGFFGLIKGFGKGIGGVVLKPQAAAFAIPAYTFKGIYKELKKHLGASVQNYIVAARTAQGYDEWNNSTEDHRLDAVRKWHDVQLELTKEKHQVKHHKTPPPCRFLKTRHMSLDEGQTTAQAKKPSKKLSKPNKTHNTGLEGEVGTAPLQHAQTYPRASSVHSESADFEEAIQMSVAATSKGNPQEDALVEKAIRASVTELQRASREGDDDEAVTRAIQASVAEAARHHNDDRDHSEQLHPALRDSVQHRPSLNRRPTDIADLDFDDSGIDTDEDENIKIALESSKKLDKHGHDDEELERALNESRRAHEEFEKGIEKQMTEEEVVLEYVKKQSLAEERYRQSVRTEDKTHSTQTSQPDENSERIA